MSHTKGIWIINLLVGLSLTNIRLFRSQRQKYSDNESSGKYSTEQHWLGCNIAIGMNTKQNKSTLQLCYTPPGPNIQNEYFEIKFYILKGSLFILPKSKLNSRIMHASQEIELVIMLYELSLLHGNEHSENLLNEKLNLKFERHMILFYCDISYNSIHSPFSKISNNQITIEKLVLTNASISIRLPALCSWNMHNNSNPAIPDKINNSTNMKRGIN